RDWRHAGAFAPERLSDVPLWLLRNHTSQMFAYPVGGGNGLSVGTSAMFLVGAIAFWRRGERLGSLLFLAPVGLGRLAAFLGKYPYGASARTMQYAAPAICLFAGLGLARLAECLPAPRSRVRLITAFLACLAGTGLVSLVVDTVRPYKSVYERNA